jgi:type IV pilus assembly protein PilE
MKTKSSRGFTLVELMIVIMIVAILAAIAYPAFNRYAFRARRAEGKDMLMQAATAEERYFTNFNTYINVPATLNLPATSLNQYYTLNIAAGTLNPVTCAVQAGVITNSYVVSAVIDVSKPQANDACGTLMLDNQGVRCPNPTNVAANVNGSCW